MLANRQVAVPGILGGLGPLSHITFEQRLIERSVQRGAQQDQDHPVWILISATATPDRTDSLKGIATDCVPWLVHYGQRLERAGADFMVVTCNTAHAFYEQVQSQLNLPWMPMIDCTIAKIWEEFPWVRRVGILATDGTLTAGIYHQTLLRWGYQSLFPGLNSPLQRRVMQAIYHPDWGIKTTGTRISNQALTALHSAAHRLYTQGAEIVVAGCSEISVGLAQLESLPLPWIDPLEVMADAVLDVTFGQRSLYLPKVA